MDKPLEEALRQAIKFLDEHAYRYAVVGGLANQYWGTPRLTNDVDIKVLVPNTEYSAVRATIRTRFPERARPDTPANPLIVDTKIAGVVVDFLLSVPGYEENIVARATLQDLGGLPIMVCSGEDLIIQKAVADRPKDWQDVEGILAEHFRDLNDAYIEEWLQQFAEVLDRPEMLDRYRSTRERIAAILKQKGKPA